MKGLADEAEIFVPTLSRRDALRAAAGAVAVMMLPADAFASDKEMADAVEKLFGTKKPSEGRIALKLPPLAESGNSVPITVSVDSLMTEADHVKRVAIFSSRNPRPLVATMMFGPKAGMAKFDTNMRLSGTQQVSVIAEMSDGSLFVANQLVKVTVGACDTLQIRY